MVFDRHRMAEEVRRLSMSIICDGDLTGASAGVLQTAAVAAGSSREPSLPDIVLFSYNSNFINLIPSTQTTGQTAGHPGGRAAGQKPSRHGPRQRNNATVAD